MKVRQLVMLFNPERERAVTLLVTQAIHCRNTKGCTETFIFVTLRMLTIYYASGSIQYVESV